MIGRDRLTKKLNEILEKIYSEGRVASTAEITSELEKFAAETDLESPAFSPPTFERGSKFDVGAYNQAMVDITDDLETLYEEDVHITEELIRQISLSDSVFRSQVGQLGGVNAQLTDLLLMSKAGAAALGSVYDDFHDLSKVDRSNTSAYLDLGLTNVTLQPNKAATRRLRPTHLMDLSTFKITALEPSENMILRQRQIAGSKAGSVFDNTTNGWQYQVLVKPEYEGPGTATIEFVVDISPHVAVEIGRLDIESMSIGDTSINVQYSKDYHNWLNFPGYTSSLKAGSAPLTLRFPATKFKALKFTMTKQEPDGETPHYEGVDLKKLFEGKKKTMVPYYQFGLKNIAMYAMGYGTEAVLQSITLIPDVTGVQAIGKASLWVDEFLPQDTNIKYELALPGSSPEWVQVAPYSRDVEGIPKIIDFGNIVESPYNENIVALPSGTVADETIHGMDIFRFGNVPSWVASTAELRVGIDAWTRSPNTATDRKSMRGCQVYFSQTDRFQYLYLVSEEEPLSMGTGVLLYSGAVPTGYDADTRLEVRHEVLTDPEGAFSLTPEKAGTGPDMPAYSVERVIHLLSDSEGDESLDLSTGGELRVDLTFGGERRVTFIPPAPPSAGAEYDMVYLEYVDVDGKTASGFFTILPALPPAEMTGDPRYVVFDPEQELRDSTNVYYSFSSGDITSLVTRISKRHIYIDRAYHRLRPGERILVKYRYILDNDQELRTSTVKVRPSNVSSAEPYVLGRDYTIDPKNKSIRHMGGGQIKLYADQPTILSVDFDYLTPQSHTHTFSTFYYLEKDLDRLQLQTMSLNPDNGDGVYVIAGGRKTDITESLELAALPAGPVQVVVDSTDLMRADKSLDVNSAIFKVMNALDPDNQPVFAKGTRYFRDQVALPTPATEVPFVTLSRSIPKDRYDYFAIDGGQAAINFDPTWAFEVDFVALDWTEEPPPGTGGNVRLSSTPEFALRYKYIPDRALNNPTGILFRATLTRNPTAAGDVTPLLNSYVIRLA